MQVPDLEDKVSALEFEANEQGKIARTATQKMDAALKEATLLEERIAFLEAELADRRRERLAQSPPQSPPQLTPPPGDLGGDGAGSKAGAGAEGKTQAELDAEWRASHVEEPASADERQACEWVARRVGTVQSDEMGQWLHDGTVLCSLVNTINEGLIRKINTGGASIKLRQNISNFLTACQNLGVPVSSS